MKTFTFSYNNCYYEYDCFYFIHMNHTIKNYYDKPGNGEDGDDLISSSCKWLYKIVSGQLQMQVWWLRHWLKLWDDKIMMVAR